jgi:hypothetical protein
MNLLGLHLQLYIGRNVPRPAPLKLSEALESVQVTHKDEGRSGFQLVLQIGRSALDLMDYSLLKNPLIQPFNRVILNVIFGVTPQPIMDGIIANQQLAPGDDPGASKLTLMGEDITLMMDLEKKSREYPSRTDFEIVQEILGHYRDYGITFDILSSLRLLILLLPRRTPEEGTKQQARLTDLGFITKLAENYGYVFYVEPGPARGVNTAYWGPPDVSGSSQRALSVNMGPNTNVESISFKYNGLVAEKVAFIRQDKSEETLKPERRRRPLATDPATPKKRVYLAQPSTMQEDEARARAQGQANKSLDAVVTANGSLDALRYGRVLKPRGLVDLRGAGASYDGTYYVKSVTHNINVRKGEYKQTFVLTREGVGTTTPFVST